MADSNAVIDLLFTTFTHINVHVFKKTLHTDTESSPTGIYSQG